MYGFLAFIRFFATLSTTTQLSFDSVLSNVNYCISGIQVEVTFVKWSKPGLFQKMRQETDGDFASGMIRGACEGSG
jgi:hypothetical protein